MLNKDRNNKIVFNLIFKFIIFIILLCINTVLYIAFINNIRYLFLLCDFILIISYLKSLDNIKLLLDKEDRVVKYSNRNVKVKYIKKISL